VFWPLIVSGSLNQVLVSLAAYEKPPVKNMGVVFNSVLSFDKQVNAVVKSCFLWIGLLAKFRKKILNHTEFERVIHAFMSSRLDYCNLIYIYIYIYIH